MKRLLCARLAAGLVALGLLAGCHGSPQSGPTVSAGGHATAGALSITDAYIPRPASTSVAGAVFTVTNSGSTPDRLLRVTSSEFGSVALHTYSTTKDGGQIMVPVKHPLLVPAHGELTLTPDGYHVMLMRPRQPISRGQTVALTLYFQNAGRVELDVPVVAMTGLATTGPSGGMSSMPGMGNMPGMG